MTSSSSKFLVVAFDIGTTFSGYGYSFCNEPSTIHTRQGWPSGNGGLISFKTPTCVLLNPKQEFDSFGFDAENKFASLAVDNKCDGWFLFRRFKMILHDNENLSRTTIIEDVNGNEMPALTIFSLAIKYLKEDFLKLLNMRSTGIKYEDIDFVITVPAIWKDRAKQFMREAAEKAGIERTRLKLSLEPEAASVWCKTISSDKGQTLSIPGKQYMVIDLGGGTADVSLHEIQSNDSLKELHKPSGGPWGGTAVDDYFMKWLSQIFGKAIFQKFKNEEIEDYFIMLREFEVLKRSFNNDQNGTFTIKLPASLKEMYEKENNETLEAKIKAMGQSKLIRFTRDKIRIEGSVIMEWFKFPLDSIIKHVKKILAEKKKVSTILLVGGFAECKVVQKSIRDAVGEMNLMVPDDAGLAVLKGAVCYGHFPKTVSSRIVSHSYGVNVSRKFDKKKHANAKLIVVDGVTRADEIFDVIIRAGETVRTGQEISKGPYTPHNEDYSVINIYRTEHANPKYISDNGCIHLGKLDIRHANGLCKDDNDFTVSFSFSGTEIYVQAINMRTKEKFSTYLDCL